MRKIYFILAATLVALVSCNKEAVPQKESSLYEPFTICATGDETKTQLSGTSVLWEEGETIRVWGQSDETGETFTQKAGTLSADKKSVTFEGNVAQGSTTVYAISPSDGASYDGSSTITATIPATQTLKDGSYASGSAICFAKIEGRTPGQESGTFTFSNLCSIIKFQVPSYVTATSIVISANSGADIAGAVTIDADATTPAISLVSSSGSKTVTVSPSGTTTISTDGTYYAVIAPGTYTGGFSFTVTTSGGKTYTASTAKELPAAAGKIYNIGSLGLKLDKVISATVAITHNVSNSTLTGSTATVTMTGLNDEFAGMVKSDSWKLYLVKNGVTDITQAYATLFEKPSATGTTMSSVSTKPYIPSGTYDLIVKYTPTTGSERTLIISKVGTSTAPTGLSLKGASSGYTSYSCYKGKDGQGTSTTNANNCEPYKIYNVGATYTSGLSDAVYTQCKDLLSFTAMVNFGGTTIKTVSSLSNVEVGTYNNAMGTYTINVSAFSFDGVSGDVTNNGKNVYITGLPYGKDKSVVDMKNDWSEFVEGTHGKWHDTYFSLWPDCSVSAKVGVVPESVNITIADRIGSYSSLYIKSTTTLKLGSTEVHKLSYQKFADTKTEEKTGNFTLSPTENSCTISFSGGTYATNWGELFYLRISYR